MIREQWITANQITATGWSQRQWLFTELTRADLIRLSDHNDNFSKYNKKSVTGYSYPAASPFFWFGSNTSVTDLTASDITIM